MGRICWRNYVVARRATGRHFGINTGSICALHNVCHGDRMEHALLWRDDRWRFVSARRGRNRQTIVDFHRH